MQQCSIGEYLFYSPVNANKLEEKLGVVGLSRKDKYGHLNLGRILAHIFREATVLTLEMCSVFLFHQPLDGFARNKGFMYMF